MRPAVVGAQAGGGSDQASRFYDIERGTLVVRHNAGFFSDCSIALLAITDFHSRFRRLPARVSFAETFRGFTDDSGRDPYLDYFEPRPDIEIPAGAAVRMEEYPHFDFRREPFAELTPFVDRYFSPSAAVLAVADALADKYAIDCSRTLAICYRGTDKGRETGLGPYSEYVDKARSYLQRDPGLRIIVQTDQRQFLDYCAAHLDAVFHIEELPLTRSDTVIHDLIAPQRRIEWAQTLLAVTTLLSCCRYVVNHSGNMGRWVCLYRRSARDTVQYLRPLGSAADAGGDFWLA
jgi:hypothetical protein